MITPAERQKEIQNTDMVKTFYNKYQVTIDTRRQMIDKFYMDDGHLVFDGNMYKSPSFVRSFWTQLPPTEHTYRSLNYSTFTIPGTGQKIVTITASGNVIYDERAYTYSQSMTCTVQSTGELKIMTDNYRLIR